MLADREFIGFDWLSYLTQNDIPFVSCMKEGSLVRDAEGWLRPLAHHFARPSARVLGPRKFQATLPARTKGAAGLDLTFHTKTLPTGEKRVLVTNRPTLAALTEYCKRWAVECVRPAHSNRWRSGPHSATSRPAASISRTPGYVTPENAT